MARIEAVASPGRGFSVSSFVMAMVFAYSASVQLNDTDWYFWLPLYTLASFVCLANMTTRFTNTSRILSRIGMISGSMLLVKVILGGFYQDGIFEWKDFISLDMNQRLVREKVGSLLVCLSMWSCARTSGNLQQKADRTGSQSRPGTFPSFATLFFRCEIHILFYCGVRLLNEFHKNDKSQKNQKKNWLYGRKLSNYNLEYNDAARKNSYYLQFSLHVSSRVMISNMW